jgi:hypothetical protein
MMDKEMSDQEARHKTGEFTMPMPDLGMDVSECLLSSMELGVKSVSWAMVKNILSGDGEYRLDHWGLHRSTRDAASSHQVALESEEQTEAGRQDYGAAQAEGGRYWRPCTHQGVHGMGLRAEQSVYWPRFWSDIGETRLKCSTCQKIAPSQAKVPPTRVCRSAALLKVGDTVMVQSPCLLGQEGDFHEVRGV